MRVFELNGTPRTELGKKACKTMRKENLIPCVIYGGKENINFTVTQSAIRKLIYTPEIFEVKLTIGKQTMKAILKEVQYHSVSDNILHVDFIEVDDKKPILFRVPIKTEGLAVGVRAGGKISLEMRKLKIKALCKDIPSSLTINVENLEIGKSIKAGDLSFPNIQIMDNKESLVVCVKSTRAAKDAAATTEAAAK
ncbi:MAG: 50S ribosomal protein L25/general stress protein Ctc [Paludibacteraceae bacterium]|nr:50S ribosomal protein L25/general stress protein Ctc [Paludibacteraceae bacterium]HPG54969.1 50S ribosomal protein L25/general stress protein Ctc [Candidatus Enterocola sp.]